MAYVLATARRPRGLGQTTGAQQTAGTVGTVGAISTPVAAPVIGGALATTSATGATTILGLSASVAIPVIGAALAGLTFAVTKLIANSGCGPTCIAATEFANKAGDLMSQNLNAYLALPAPRAKTAQTVALANFDSLWSQLVNLCTNDPSVRGTTAGRNCIADRQAGACKWKASPGGWVQQANGTWTYKGWGPAGSGTDCWNWFIGLRDPIAQDPAVFDDTEVTQAAATTAAAGGAPSGAAPSAGVSWFPLLLGGAVLLGVLWLSDRSL